MAYENNVYEFPSGQQRENQEAEQPQFLPADVGAETLDAYIQFRQSQGNAEDVFTGADYQRVRALLQTLSPIFTNEGEAGIYAKLQEINEALANGTAFERYGVTIQPSDVDTINTALQLIELARKEKDAFLAWQQERADGGSDEEEEGGAAAIIGEQLFAAPSAIAAEQALTETWKNQTRHISDEMKKLQTEVTLRRLTGLPHIFPPDFESIIGQFIYRINRVTELKPTMISEFESEFSDLLAYFDLRMLRTAGEELDQELADDPESLQRVDASLDTIDEQLTNLMLLQTSQPLIQELRNVKYRLDLLREKIQRAIKNTDSTEEDKRIAA